jgi:hypothetical protein
MMVEQQTQPQGFFQQMFGPIGFPGISTQQVAQGMQGYQQMPQP